MSSSIAMSRLCFVVVLGAAPNRRKSVETLSNSAISTRRSIEQTRIPLSMRVIWLRSTQSRSASSSWVIPRAFLALCSRFPKPYGSKPGNDVLLLLIVCICHSADLRFFRILGSPNPKAEAPGSVERCIESKNIKEHPSCVSRLGCP